MHNTSIHALQAECDDTNKLKTDGLYETSIHALQAECDSKTQQLRRKRLTSIHALQAECDPNNDVEYSKWQTSIHALQAECDIKDETLVTYNETSIHALQAECDHGTTGQYIATEDFNPRTPSGVRPRLISARTRPQSLQSTHSKRSATHFLHDMTKN